MIYNKRVLIVSNNVLSKTKNNGKTIYSLFEGVNKKNIRQLYMSAEEPEIQGIHYFRISDRNILNSYKNWGICGDEVEVKNTISSFDNDVNETIRKKVKRNALTCFIRDIVWNNRWKTSKLLNWLDSYEPQVIFFVAGDTFFSYKIALFIKKRFQCRFIVYVTDDYVLPREKESVLSRQRRKRNLKYLKQTITIADVFVTISEKMREEYHTLLGRDSIQLVNIPEHREYRDFKYNKFKIKMVYAGSLYYGRYDALMLLADAVKDYCESHNCNIEIDIYTHSWLERKQVDKIENGGVAKVLGGISANELEKKLECADVLIFVESFDEKNIEKTRLSLSTKVPEYLSYGKPIVAFGPQNVGSIEYLQDVACCITTLEKESIRLRLNDLLNDGCNMERLAKAAYSKYVSKHKKEEVQKKVLKEIMGE